MYLPHRHGSPADLGDFRPLCAPAFVFPSSSKMLHGVLKIWRSGGAENTWRRVQFHRIRDFKQYYFNSTPGFP